jgi:hypothetical protein
MGWVVLNSIDHNKNRSYFTEHPKQNNKHLTPAYGGQFISAKDGQGHLLFQSINEFKIDEPCFNIDLYESCF